MTARCGGCPHTEHRGACRRLGPSRCVPLAGGMACGVRPPCPCPWRTCKCGAEVAAAILDTDHGVEVPVIRGSAGDPSGTLEVWRDIGGGLLCREVSASDQVAAGRWRGVEHTGPCQPF